ncbi:hypothetical protein PYCCODRAFT_839440 [Trametes coccinea BRFM310]|uniref:Uncharacterized protein n=1 Tax=Trametes coccinea (strain BRFM310) TaxID=1353009 RepID=A0A1Y2IE55_TRAC3|nr:hypothetical protein PYCCODRAFT_839440 [Trametes coccinea BRFM310]
MFNDFLFPQALHAGSPSSDAEAHTQRSWQSSTPAYHPSTSFQASQHPSQPILRQPVGFGSNPPSVPTYQAPPPQSIPSTPQYLTGQNPPSEQPSSVSRKKSSKGKEKDTSKSSPRKAKAADKVAASHPVSTQPYPPPPPGSVHAVQKTAFRVESYSNDRSANGSLYATQDGPYGAAFRADLPDRPKVKSSKKKSKSTAQQGEAAQLPAQALSQAPAAPGNPASSQYYPYQSAQQPPAAQQYSHPTTYHYPPQSHPPPAPAPPPHSYPQPGQGAPDQQGRAPYYRYDYEKLRQTAPAYRARMAASQSQSPGPGPAAPPPHHSYPTQHALPNPDQPSHSSRSSKPKDTHVYHNEYQYPPSPEYDQRDPSPPSPPADYYDSYPPQPPPSYHPSRHPPYPPSYPPPSVHSSEKRHKSKSRAHRHDHHSSPAPPPPGPYDGAPHVPDVPPPAVRVCRVLTLLIEDKRNMDGESMLAEVRVPLKQLDGGDEGYWADAQEVTEELQKGPSRIDGRCHHTCFWKSV